MNPLFEPRVPNPRLTPQWSGRATTYGCWHAGVRIVWPAAEHGACVPCMLSCSGVKVPCPGIRGAEGQEKRKGVTARWGLKEAWNEGAGRGTGTGYEVWHSRDERARDREVLHPQLGCAL
jgi:hypothetical protein